MNTEKQIIEDITELEKCLFDEETYLDESEQSKLQTLYQTLGRKLKKKEKEVIYKKRLDFMEECLGESDKEWISKEMYYDYAFVWE